MLIAQFSKLVVFAKRKTDFNGTEYKYITGVDCTSGACFTDLGVTADSPIKWENVQENTIYDYIPVNSVIKGEKNGLRTTAASLHQRVGVLEVKLDAKK